jgi:hypothetical protein
VGRPPLCEKKTEWQAGLTARDPRRSAEETALGAGLERSTPEPCARSRERRAPVQAGTASPSFFALSISFWAMWVGTSS